MTQKSAVSESQSPVSILVIDSGVGGLSICREILATGIPAELLYVADNALFPYGLLSEERLTQRLIEILDSVLLHHQPALVVLACNTVSTLVLPVMRERYQVPFVGVVPAIKPAAAISKTRCIGLLATPATVRRPYTDQLINDFAADCEVVRVGSNDLVIEAERLLDGKGASPDVVLEVIKPFLIAHRGRRVDALVLGCTHFPLLRDMLGNLLPGVSLIDSGAAIARRVANLLRLESGHAPRTDLQHQIYFTGALPSSPHFAQALREQGIASFGLSTLALGGN